MPDETLTGPGPIDRIEETTRRFARAREFLRERVQSLENDMQSVRRRRMKGIKSAVAAATTEQEALAALLIETPNLFTAPRRTLTIDGIKVGYRKSKGTIVIADESATIRRIRKLLPDQADVLIKVKETVIKNAVPALAVSDLKRLGIEVEADTDEIVIKPVDSEVDKLVDALLQDCLDDPEEGEE